MPTSSPNGATPAEQDPSQLSDFDRLQQLQSRGYEPCTIDGVPFWINPDGYRFETEQLYTEVPTAAGYGFFDFGTKPYDLVLDGWTGTAGRYWLDNPAKMRKFRPQFGQPTSLVSFTYPVRFAGAQMARVVRFQDMMDRSRPYCWRYQIQLRIYPKARPSYQKLPSTSKATNLLPPVSPGSNQNVP